MCLSLQQGIYLLQLLQDFSRRHTGGHQLLDGFLKFCLLGFLRSLSIGFCLMLFQIGELGIQLLQLCLLRLQVSLQIVHVLFKSGNLGGQGFLGGCFLGNQSCEVGSGDGLDLVLRSFGTRHEKHTPKNILRCRGKCSVEITLRDMTEPDISQITIYQDGQKYYSRGT